MSAGTMSLNGQIELIDSATLDRVGGFVVSFGNKCRITMSTKLTESEKAEGIEYLIEQFANKEDNRPLIHYWVAQPQI